MSKKMKYEKPLCVDAGTVAPVLGLNCSMGNGAADICQQGNGAVSDCSVGYGNAYVPACNIGGGDNYCDAQGNGANLVCNVGNSPL